MAHAYAAGLQVTAGTRLRKTRLLPMRGEVLVAQGQVVEPEAVVARAELPGDVHAVNVMNRLGIQAHEVRRFMLKDVGHQVEAGEALAETRPWLKLFRATCPSPVRGTIESISEVTGQVMVREPARQVELRACVRGHVTEIIPREGAIVETHAAFVQGIFGIGGETHGPLIVPVTGPGQVMETAAAGGPWNGSVVVAGALITADLMRAAICGGAHALIAAGIAAQDLYDILGYELGVAVTGAERVGLTIIITEGFGRIPMAAATFALLKSLEGRVASVNGATQIRAGVQRPEIIVPLDGPEPDAVRDATQRPADGLNVGDRVRLIRKPYFGLIGRVSELVPELVAIETESRLRVMRVRLEDGRTVTVPRANVEVIQH